MALNEQDSPSVGKSKSTPTVNESSPSTGPMSPDTETLPLWIGQPFNPLTCSVGDSPVKTSALPGSEQGSTEQDQDCGVNTSEPFAHFDPATCWWKTYQGCLLTLTWDEYSETWPRAGTMRNGIAFQQVPLAPLTGETGYGLWPTPTSLIGSMYLEENAHERNSMGLGSAVHLWPTPTQRDWKDTGANTNYEAIAAKSRLAGTVGGSLNPTWVEWLMGYPLGWTDLKD